MANVKWRKLPGLIADILRNAPQYNFFQLLHLLEAQQTDLKLLVCPNDSIAFPASDIKKCSLDDNSRLLLETTFMGLYGVDSPLPHYFLQQMLADTKQAEMLRRFINIFNQRIYQLLYLAWKKYRPGSEQKKHLQRLSAISGNVVKLQDGAAIALAGIHGARVHNAQALTGAISEYLQGVRVKIHQFVSQWEHLGLVLCLGATKIKLSDNALIGEKIISLSGKIIIEIGPISFLVARSLLPETKNGKRLGDIIKQYLGPIYQFDLIFYINSTTSDCLALGKQNIHLGWMSWIGAQLQSTYQLRFSGKSMGVLI